ncbi:trypsin-like peptidase domain-containing protein [Candidatus Acetothermia bacterium]|nr:trypsin-like peptidase domain-containing protein [Candidatus Acetothermia bacterium]
MDMTSGYSMALPVMPAKVLDEGRFQITASINGTCFSIGGPYMLTAGHVIAIKPKSESDALVVGIQGPDGFFKAAKVIDAELLPCDLGLLRVEFVFPESENWFHRLKWSEHPLQPLETVRSAGYAYGMHIVEEHQSVVVRAFQGHIVSGLNNFKPLGMEGRPFSVYELSFMAPRGLSGAPLLNASGTVVVHGVVIGNSESRMVVFRSQEQEAENGKTSSFEQYEALTLGVAVQAEEVLQQSSLLLGTTIREHLERYELLSARPQA